MAHRGRPALASARPEAEVTLARLTADGLRPLVSRVEPLERVADALADVGARRTTGKVVLAVVP